MINQFLLMLSVILLCAGCAPSSEQRACDTMITAIEKRVQKRLAETAKFKAGDLSAEEARLQKGFLMLAIGGDQAALAALKKEGTEAMRQPLITFGEIAPSPVPDSERTPDTPPYSHLLYLEWLEFGCDVTGFYLEMEDGTTFEFDGSIDERGESFADEVRLGPSRSIPIALALATDVPDRQGLIRFSPEQFAKVLQERKARRVGLIYKDGLKSETGVVGYSVRYRGFL